MDVMTKRMQQLLHSSAFYAHPSALKGSARLMDLFGHVDEYHVKSAKQENKEALQRDWAIVGKDINDAIKTYGQQSSSSKTTEKK